MTCDVFCSPGPGSAGVDEIRSAGKHVDQLGLSHRGKKPERKKKKAAPPPPPADFERVMFCFAPSVCDFFSGGPRRIPTTAADFHAWRKRLYLRPTGGTRSIGDGCREEKSGESWPRTNVVPELDRTISVVLIHYFHGHFTPLIPKGPGYA